MAARDEIIAFCDELLDVGSFEDYGPNGLQVPGAAEVERRRHGVSANLELLEAAVEAGAQLVLAHHGLLWGSELAALSAPMAARLRALLCADVSLAAYHLPLDAHPEIGNNALLRDALGLEADGTAVRRGEGIARSGSIGRAPEPLSIDELDRARCGEVTGQEPLVFDAGPDRISRVGIVTGGGAFAIHEAGRLGLDALVTGEPSEPVMGEAREYGIHFLAAGHYATETLRDQAARRAGRRALRGRARFIDVPNPV